MTWSTGTATTRCCRRKATTPTCSAPKRSKIIRNHDKTTPLFLYLAFTAPHTPYQAPKAWLDTYADIADDLRRAYAAQISAMDDAIGKVVTALDESRLRQNTLIVFHSDNGGTRSAMFAGKSAVKGDLPPNNGVYRDGKGTLYEGGTRVAGFANWPGAIQAGHVKGPVHIADMYPTLAALAGAKTDKAKPMDGINVWSAVAKGEASPRTEVVYNIEPYRVGVRQGDLKLIWAPILPGKLELYDLADDPSETKNLAAANPQQVEKLQRRAEQLAKEAMPPLLFGQMVKTTFSAPPSTPQGDQPASPLPKAASKGFLSDLERADD